MEIVIGNRGLDILFISELSLMFVQWHDVHYFPIDLNVQLGYFGIVVILPGSQQPNDFRVNFWGIYEIDFPE
jgi:hypothetical protein